MPRPKQFIIDVMDTLDRNPYAQFSSFQRKEIAQDYKKTISYREKKAAFDAARAASPTIKVSTTPMPVRTAKHEAAGSRDLEDSKPIHPSSQKHCNAKSSELGGSTLALKNITATLVPDLKHSRIRSSDLENSIIALKDATAIAKVTVTPASASKRRKTERDGRENIEATALTIKQEPSLDADVDDIPFPVDDCDKAHPKIVIHLEIEI